MTKKTRRLLLQIIVIAALITLIIGVVGPATSLFIKQS